jgi:hypothetical protein
LRTIPANLELVAGILEDAIQKRWPKVRAPTASAVADRSTDSFLNSLDETSIGPGAFAALAEGRLDY